MSPPGCGTGTTVSLSPVDTPPTEGSAQYLGTLSQLSTTDPALTCLENEPPIGVWSYSALPGVDVVVAAQPQDCASALWTFVPPAPDGRLRREPAHHHDHRANDDHHHHGPDHHHDHHIDDHHHNHHDDPVGRTWCPSPDPEPAPNRWNQSDLVRGGFAGR